MTREGLLAVCALALLAVVLLWPAFVNGYPLLFTDSIGYINDGQAIAHLRTPHNTRLMIYGLVLWPFHLEISLWPAAVVQVLAISWLVWLFVRAAVGETLSPLMTVLLIVVAGASTLPWYAARIMPDVFSGVLILCFCLLVFYVDRLSTLERIGVWALAAFACSVHTSHWLIALSMLALAVVVRLLGARSVRWFGVGAGAVALALSIVPSVVLSLGLYGSPNPNYRSPPFLLASVLADGSASDYLKNRCGSESYLLCNYLDQLPPYSANAFLWLPDSPLRVDGNFYKVKAEEGRIVFGTLAADPTRLLGNILDRFSRQLVTFGYGELLNDGVQNAIDARETTAWMQSDFSQARQGQSLEFPEFKTGIDAWYLWSMAGICVALVALVVFARQTYLLPMFALAAVGLMANAAVTGGISGVFDRYQGRAVWVVPVLLLVCVGLALRGRKTAPAT